MGPMGWDQDTQGFVLVLKSYQGWALYVSMLLHTISLQKNVAAFRPPNKKGRLPALPFELYLVLFGKALLAQ